MVQVNKVGHVVLSVKDPEKSAKFYSEVLGMEIVSYNEERRSAFLSFGTQHHDIALFCAPIESVRGQIGLNHIAFQINGGVEELHFLHERLLAYGAIIDRTSDHGITTSVYFFDPDGNRIEVFCEMMDPEEGLNYMRNRGSTREKANAAIQ